MQQLKKMGRFLAFRKYYVKNIAEAIDNPKDIQFTLKQYWNNLPTAEIKPFQLIIT